MPSPRQPRRRRLRRLDAARYRGPLTYLLTFCQAQARALFGRVDHGRVRLTPAGEMVLREWAVLPRRFVGLRMIEHVLMPDHMHAVVEVPETTTVGRVVGAFKSITTVLYLKEGVPAGWPHPGRRLWQRGYHDSVLWTTRDIAVARRYVRRNPANWNAGR